MTEEQCIGWVKANMPFAIRPVRKARTTLIYPYTSRHAQGMVAECIGKQLYQLMKGDPYPDREADGWVFCGKCGQKNGL